MSLAQAAERLHDFLRPLTRSNQLTLTALRRTRGTSERHFRRAVREFVEHYHRERNHQRLGNALIMGAPPNEVVGLVRRRTRLGGLLNYYERAA